MTAARRGRLARAQTSQVAAAKPATLTRSVPGIGAGSVMAEGCHEGEAPAAGGPAAGGDRGRPGRDAHITVLALSESLNSLTLGLRPAALILVLAYGHLAVIAQRRAS